MLEIVLLTIFIWIPVLIVLVRNIFTDTYLWQIKEYRVDRILSHIRYREGETYRNRSINILQVALLICIGIFFVQPINILLIVPTLVFASYVIEALNRGQEFIAKKFIRPKISLRNILITGLSLVTLLLPLIIPINFANNIIEEKPQQTNYRTIDNQIVTFEDILVQNDTEYGTKTIPLVIAIVMITTFLAIASDLVSPLVVSFWAIITEPLAQYKRSKIIRKAKKKIGRHKGFKVVAITGSYGKSSTKEILYELIKDNFKTAKTDENFNAPVGIAQSVLLNLKKDTEVFIAEMGAYTRGEIAKSTHILPPNISIITGIAPQHLSLFGSMKNLIKAKYEIVDNLNPKGLAIFNGNNQYCVQMAAQTEQRKLLYYTIDDQTEIAHPVGNNDKTDFPDPTKGMLYAIDIKEENNTFTFKLKYQNIQYPVVVQVNAKHDIQNILAAIGAAMDLGMDIKSIVAKLQVMKLPDNRVQWKEGINNSKLLDDTYNTNPEGFKSIISTANKVYGRKILITRGIIETGKEKKNVYSYLGKVIEQSIDVLITTDNTLPKYVNKEKVDVKVISSDEEVFRFATNNVREGDIIILEGRLSPSLIQNISQ